jgi:hypothetical protein
MGRFGTRRWIAALAVAFFIAATTPVPAQTVGVRAQGMGGAFTGVADDASAVYWNPAGLASGAYFSGVLDFNSLGGPSGSVFGYDSSATLVSFAMPALGFSYYRTRSLVRTSPAFPTTAPASSSAARDITLGSLVTNQFGATVVQSLWGGLAIGATLKLVHGVTSIDSTATRFDADLGLMESGSVGRLGITIRNLLRPSFGDALVAEPALFRLDREVRIGGSINVSDSTLLAADADLTRNLRTGIDRRDAAVGVEQHVSSKAVLRGGIHWNTRLGYGASVGDANIGAAPEASVGGSYAFYGRTSADAQITFGSTNGDRGWGVGLRMVF